MTRLLIALAFCAILTVGVAQAADEDPVAATLATAKTEYEKSIGKAREGLLADLKKKADVAQKAGDPDTLEKVEKEIKAFEVNGTRPRSVSVIDFMEAERVAKARLKVAYETAVKDYTVAGKKELAKAAQTTWDEIKNEGEAPKAPVVKAPPADDGFAVGTRIKAKTVITWGPPNKRESREGGMFFTVTKRSGSEFTIENPRGGETVGKIENGMVTFPLGKDNERSFLGRFEKSKGTFTGRFVSKTDPTWRSEVKGEVVKDKE